MSTKRAFWAVSMVWLLFVAGCSVGMAMSGKKEPNLGAIREGATRGEVEMHLGSPVSSVTTQDNRTDIYEYQIGNEPSAGRAAGHAALDILTLGIWEVAGTPIEAFQGEKRSISITYGPDDRVVSINRPIPLPSDKSAEQVQVKKPETKAGSLEEKLDQLKTLKDKGKITEEEYARMRQDILRSASKD